MKIDMTFIGGQLDTLFVLSCTDNITVFLWCGKYFKLFKNEYTK